MSRSRVDGERDDTTKVSRSLLKIEEAAPHQEYRQKTIDRRMLNIFVPQPAAFSVPNIAASALPRCCTESARLLGLMRPILRRFSWRKGSEFIRKAKERYTSGGNAA